MFAPMKRKGGERSQHRFHTILVPIDRSGLSKTALLHAAALARAFDAKLRLLHVSEIPPVLPAPEADSIGRELWIGTTEFRAQAQAQIEAWVEETPDLFAIDPEIVIRTGLPGDEIILEVEDSVADLVVLTTHGRTGFQRFLLGSVAEKVTLSAPCPVLSIRPAAAPRPGHPAPARLSATPRRILVPTDLSPVSFDALPVAVAIAERFGGEAVLFTVLEDPVDHPEIEWEERAGITAEEVKARTAAVTRAQLREKVEELGFGQAIQRIEVGFGRTVPTLLHRAEAEGFELIVMASHGRGPLARAILGSVAREVVRHAPCPVLTVRA